ncbi:MAG: T9SS C-terminal target domain-containing protein [Calditrichaeota bacterium]|nr:MAG: T9SS C-terminal target domain-containing protein [Calditrichota bacterium]
MQIVFSLFLALLLTQDLFSTERRIVNYSPNQSLVTEGVYLDKIEFKIWENEGFDFVDGKLISTNIEKLEQLNSVLNSQKLTLLRKSYTSPKEELNASRSRAEQNLNKILPDLNLFFIAEFEKSTKTEVQNLIDDLNRLDFVEVAFPCPIPKVPVCNVSDISPTTPNYQGSQGYLSPAPLGVDANFGWTIPGGTGQGIVIIDLENAWNENHEDYCIDPNYVLNGTSPGSGSDFDHGTAVLGEMVGQDNGYGITGIVPDATAGVHSWAAGGSFGNTIMVTSLSINQGDFILLEVHIPGPNHTGGTSQFGLVPCEWNISAYFAIQTATGDGRVVIQAAGNGQQDLDAPEYNDWFLKSNDSGAVTIGAGTPSANAPEWFTNYGETVDLSGWGSGVYTAGYGEITFGTNDVNQEYTNSFGGTSSASPIVTGALASLQGFYKNVSGGTATLSALDLRDLFMASGSPQAQSFKQIGVRPNIQGAYNLLGGTIQGQITDSFGNPIEGARVETQSKITTTDSLGNYSVLIPQGTQELKVFKFGFEPLIISKNLTLGEFVQQDTVLQNSVLGDFNGTILSDNSQPIENVKVELFANYGNIDEVKLTVQSDVNGNFSFSQIPVSYSEFLNYSNLSLVPKLNFEIKSLPDTFVVANSNPLQETFSLKTTQVLLIDDDTGANYEANYLTALEDLEIPFYYWNVVERGEISADTLNQLIYKNVIWETGDFGTNPLNSANLNSIETFLNNGGNIFLTGEDVVNSLTGTILGTNVFGIQIDANGTTNSFIKSVQNDPLGNDKLYSVNGVQQNGKDAMINLNGTTAFNYGVSSNFSPAVVYNSGTNWKTVVSGFSLSAILESPNPSLSGLENFMESLLIWWDVLADSKEISNSPFSFKLSQNYPNPFNPTTSINYELEIANSENAKLVIFNILGETVKEFELEEKKGTVIWNGTDSKNSLVSSGIYFYKLSAGKFQEIKKMTLIH